ncbi:U32 family peptidase [Clostridium sediminicola]|uniref:U32 family peptidase n=1 Tax=Clostridium sediminicola TaxID=3114879 RepID=UPI0031F25485
MKKIELLAPAGSLESLYAAVLNGADAIYLGGKKFSARAYASNFDEEKLKEAVDYCHIYGVKMYVTVNTLIKDNEIDEAIEFIGFLHSINVDAIIIQDTGLAYLVRNIYPNLSIHASTQMTIHNNEGAQLIKEKGFSRVVLSRELSINEIEEISNKSGIETEVFIHGALCISYSGQCLMSSMIGGRSGNRGKCAQPCRLPYELINKDTKKSTKAFILSPKDVCTISNINEIIKTGTASLKIEGRMKRPEYVAGVVSSYRKAIDSYYNGEKFNVEKEINTLKQLFNREGFSKAFLYGNEGKEMMALKYPKNTGVLLGKINDDYTIDLKEDISVSDGIRIDNSGFTVSKIIKNGKEVQSAKKGDSVSLKPSKYKKSNILYKTLDSSLMERLSGTYKDKYTKKIPINIRINFKIGEPVHIYTQIGDENISVLGEEVQSPLKRPLDKERIIKSLKKTGNTPFIIENVHFESYEEGFLPISVLNSIRRKLTDEIFNLRLNRFNKDVKVASLNNKHDINETNIETQRRKIFVTVIKNYQLETALKLGYKNIIIDYFMRECDIELKNLQDCNAYIRIPSIVKEEFNYICKEIDNNLHKIVGIVTSNSGIIRKYHRKTEVLGDYKINVFNKNSLSFYNDYLDGVFLSVELNKKELIELAKDAYIPVGTIIYGKTELMITEYCPVGSCFGKKKRSICNKPCEGGEFTLKDRLGMESDIILDKFCRSHLLNSKKINLISNMAEIKKINVPYYRLDFTNENNEDTLKVLEACKNGKWEEEFNDFTRGHFKRGVE